MKHDTIILSKDKDATALSVKTAVLAREVDWDQAELYIHVATYINCSSGRGVCGILCCRYWCTTAYTRRLADTAKEMECQTVSVIGNEVSDLIELFHDSQKRLQQAAILEMMCQIQMILRRPPF